MKKSLLLCLTLLAGGLSASAAEKSATEKLLEVMRYEELTMESAMAGFDGVMEQQIKAQGMPAKAVAEVRIEANKLYRRIFTGPEARRRMIDLYEKHFTEDEIHEMTEFYSTPLGRKTLVAMPSILQDVMNTVMPALQKEMPAFEQKVAAITEKYLPAAPPDEEEDAAE